MNDRLNAREWKRLQDLQAKASLPDWIRTQDIDGVGGAQSMIFMGDLLPAIFGLLASRQDWNAPLSILDVGPGAAFGSNFLGALMSGGFIGPRGVVSVLDIDPTYREFILTKHPYVSEFHHYDIYEFQQKFDFVICSHVIEHVPEPERFVRRLQALAKERVFLAAPFEEPSDNMGAGHINSLDDEFLARIGAINIRKLESVGWGLGMTPRYKMFVAELPAAELI